MGSQRRVVGRGGNGASPISKSKNNLRSKVKRTEHNKNTVPPPAKRVKTALKNTAPESDQRNHAAGSVVNQASSVLSPLVQAPIRRSPRKALSPSTSGRAFVRISPRGDRRVCRGAGNGAVATDVSKGSVPSRLDDGVRAIGNENDDEDDDDIAAENPERHIHPHQEKEIRTSPLVEPLAARLSHSGSVARCEPGSRTLGIHRGRSSRSSYPDGELPNPSREQITPVLSLSERTTSVFRNKARDRAINTADPSLPISDSNTVTDEFRELQRGMIRATKKLLGKTEKTVTDAVERINTEMQTVSTMLREQKKELENLKEYTNMLMYAVGGKGKESNSLLNVVRSGVDKMFSAPTFLPVMRNAFVIWAVEGVVDGSRGTSQLEPAAMRTASANVLRSTFFVRPTAGRRSEGLAVSYWAQRNQALRGLTVRSILNYAMGESNRENLFKLPGSKTEESKPSWLRNLRDSHLEAVLRTIENGTDEPRGSKKSTGNVITTKEISEGVVHRVHSVVVAFLNRSRERMRTTFFTTCSFIFDKHVNVSLCDGDLRPNSRLISSIPLAKTGSDISRCGQEVEENEDIWNKVKQELSFMSYFVEYEVTVSDDTTSPGAGEERTIRRIISALGVGLELCLSLTQCASADEFFLISEHSLQMVFMFAVVVREIMLEKVSDVSCVIAENNSDFDQGTSGENTSNSTELSILELCALMQPPSSSSRVRLLQKSVLHMSNDKYDVLHHTDEQDLDRERDCRTDDGSGDGDDELSDRELDELMQE